MWPVCSRPLVELVLKPQNKTNEVVAAYRAAAERGNASAQCKLAGIYRAGEGVPVNPTEAAKWYRRAMEHYRQVGEGGDTEAQNNLAWLLATCMLSEVRDGRQAVEVAEKAVAATKRQDDTFLATLAAAYAEAGDFRKAVSAQKEALARVRDADTRRDYQSRLELYESNQPYREADYRL